MSGDRRHNWGLIIDVLNVLEQHGYRQADDQHTGRAVGLDRRPGPHLPRHPGSPGRRLRRVGAPAAPAQPGPASAGR